MIKQTDIRKQELTRRLNRINDKLNELLGEKTTLVFKFKQGQIHPILASLKEEVINFEAHLLNEEVKQISTEYEFIELVENSGLDFMA